MKYAIVIFLENGWSKALEDVRGKFVLNSDVVKPHISLIYSFDFENLSLVREHIKNVVSKFNSFDLKFDKFGKFVKDFYLYFLPSVGFGKLLELHNKLQSRVLTDVVNLDLLEYIPHVTFGVFDNLSDINSALKFCESSELSYFLVVDKIQLISFDDDLKINTVEDFNLM